MRGVLKIVVLALTMFSLLLIISEVSLRTKGDYYTPQEQVGGDYTDQYSGYQNHSWYHVRQPNTEVKIITEEFQYKGLTNSIGIMDEEHPLKKPTGEFRIATLGDSFTEGYGSIPDSSWQAILENEINKTTDSTSTIEIIRGGVAGSDPFFSYSLLRDKLIQFDPDLVLVAINNTDIGDIIAGGGIERFLADSTVHENNGPFLRRAYMHSHLVRWFYHSFLFGNYDWLFLSRSDRERKEEEAIAQLRSLISEFITLGRKNDSSVIFVTHPVPEEADAGEYNSSTAPIKEYLNDNNIDHIDILEAINNLPLKERKELYWPLDGHHTPRGYKLMGTTIAKYLQNQKYLLADEA